MKNIIISIFLISCYLSHGQDSICISISLHNIDYPIKNNKFKKKYYQYKKINLCFSNKKFIESKKNYIVLENKKYFIIFIKNNNKIIDFVKIDIENVENLCKNIEITTYAILDSNNKVIKFYREEGIYYGNNCNSEIVSIKEFYRINDYIKYVNKYYMKEKKHKLR